MAEDQKGAGGSPPMTTSRPPPPPPLQGVRPRIYPERTRWTGSEGWTLWRRLVLLLVIGALLVAVGWLVCFRPSTVNPPTAPLAGAGRPSYRIYSRTEPGLDVQVVTLEAASESGLRVAPTTPRDGNVLGLCARFIHKPEVPWLGARTATLEFQSLQPRPLYRDFHTVTIVVDGESRDPAEGKYYSNPYEGKVFERVCIEVKPEELEDISSAGDVRGLVGRQEFVFGPDVIEALAAFADAWREVREASAERPGNAESKVRPAAQPAPQPAGLHERTRPRGGDGTVASDPSADQWDEFADRFYARGTKYLADYCATLNERAQGKSSKVLELTSIRKDLVRTRSLTSPLQGQLVIGATYKTTLMGGSLTHLLTFTITFGFREAQWFLISATEKVNSQYVIRPVLDEHNILSDEQMSRERQARQGDWITNALWEAQH